MDKRTEFGQALKDAMRAKDEIRVGTLRLILSTLKDKDIGARGTGKEIGEGDILSMLQSMIKQRNESLKTYRDAGREDLAGREEAEIKIIESFMPAQMGEAEIQAAIDAAIKDTGAASIKDMGKIMGVLKEKYAGQMDMAAAGAMIKTRLG